MASTPWQPYRAYVAAARKAKSVTARNKRAGRKARVRKVNAPKSIFS